MIFIYVLLLFLGVPIISSNPLNGVSDEIGPEYIFEDDIIIYDAPDSEEDSLPDAVASALRLWDMKDMEVIVPYTTPDGLSDHQQEQIRMALEEFKTKTCIVFRQRSNETDYVHIDPINYPISCRSAVGKKGGKQIVRCGNCKSNGTFHYGVLLHELMHTIGFVHEQNRSDRDSYISVDFDEIENFERDEGWPNGTWAKQFMKCNYTRIGKKYGCKILNSYDKESITHYPANIGESNPRTIISSRVPCGKKGCNFGQRVGLSDGDIADIERLYKCSIKYRQHKGLCNARLRAKDNSWALNYNQLVRKSDEERFENLKNDVDLLKQNQAYQNTMLEQITKLTNVIEEKFSPPNEPRPSTTESSITSLPNLSPSSTPILSRCTVNGNTGDGTSRGSCNEGWICQSDGSCVETCKDNGQPGDSSTRGTCQEGYLCRVDGGCVKGCRVNGNEIGDGTSQGNCNTDHLCESSGFCRHRKISITASCEGTYNTLHGIIRSPNYPTGYGINQTCLWKIEAPLGRQLILKFNSFDTETNFDKLHVYDGPTINSVRMIAIWGDKIPDIIVSTGNSITLKFVSDHKNNHRGFELQYSLRNFEEYEVIENKRCTGSYEVYSALDVAISQCASPSCAIQDDGCDDHGIYKVFQQCDNNAEEISNDGSCIYRGKTGVGLLNGSIKKIADHLGYTFYKVKVDGKMSSENVNDTCQKFHLDTVCYYYGKNGCSYSTPQCPIIQATRSCTNTMPEISQKLCGNTETYKCDHLDDVFVYMNNWQSGSACGKVGNVYCATGNAYENKWALCVKKTP